MSVETVMRLDEFIAKMASRGYLDAEISISGGAQWTLSFEIPSDFCPEWPSVCGSGETLEQAIEDVEEEYVMDRKEHERIVRAAQKDLLESREDRARRLRQELAQLEKQIGLTDNADR